MKTQNGIHKTFYYSPKIFSVVLSDDANLWGLKPSSSCNVKMFDNNTSDMKHNKNKNKIKTAV